VLIIALLITQKLRLQLGSVSYPHLHSTSSVVALSLSKLHVPLEDSNSCAPTISGSGGANVNYLPLTAFGGIFEFGTVFY
jgi:hypothetical protein